MFSFARLRLFFLVSLVFIARYPWAQQSDQSRTVDLVGTDSPNKTVTVPRSYALVIGVTRYRNLPEKAQLKFPQRDADDIYDTLISAEAGQFPPENVHQLINEKATREAIRHELEDWLPSVAQADDRVLIYFAGHGFIAGGRGYLGPYDLDPKNIAESAYPMDQLGRVFGGKIKGKWKVLLTDACHSGAITPEDDPAAVNRQLLTLNNSLFSLTASRDREQSFEDERWGGGHGVFTYFVVKGLQGQADTSNDGIVTADELAEYVRRNVREATGQRQNPTSDRGSFDSHMLLAYNPTPCDANCGQKQGSDTGTFIVETNMDKTELWIDGKNVGTVDRDKPLRLPGMQPGKHMIKGVHLGYEPDGPREEQALPGQETTISLRLFIPRRPVRSAQQPFEKGLEYYSKGEEKNYRAAAAQFSEATRLDPKFSRAELYLGRSYRGLYQLDESQAAMKRAIEIDPDFLEARTSYAGVLLDVANFNEAVRQMQFVTRREPQNGTAWYLLSQAFARKGNYAPAVEAAKKAIQYAPWIGESHLWLADAYRLDNKCAAALPAYEEYLSLSNFDTKLLGRIEYWGLGSLVGMGKKKRAEQVDIWRKLRQQADFGICDCEYVGRNYEKARQYCLRADALDKLDVFTKFRLATVEVGIFNQRNSYPILAAAIKHFEDVVAINPDLDMAKDARQNIDNIRKTLHDEQ